MTDIKNIIFNELGINTKISKKSNSNHCFSITYSRTEDVKKLLEWLYSDSKFHMERKFQKAQEVLSLIK